MATKNPFTTVHTFTRGFATVTLRQGRWHAYTSAPITIARPRTSALSNHVSRSIRTTSEGWEKYHRTVIHDSGYEAPWFQGRLYLTSSASTHKTRTQTADENPPTTVRPTATRPMILDLTLY